MDPPLDVCSKLGRRAGAREQIAHSSDRTYVTTSRALAPGTHPVCRMTPPLCSQTDWHETVPSKTSRHVWSHPALELDWIPIQCSQRYARVGKQWHTRRVPERRGRRFRASSSNCTDAWNFAMAMDRPSPRRFEPRQMYSPFASYCVFSRHARVGAIGGNLPSSVGTKPLVITCLIGTFG